MNRLTATAYKVSNMQELKDAAADWDDGRRHVLPELPGDAFPMIACFSMCDGHLRVESISEKTIEKAGYFKNKVGREKVSFQCDIYGAKMTASYAEGDEEHDFIVVLDDEDDDVVQWCGETPDIDNMNRIEAEVAKRCRAHWESVRDA